MNMKEAFMNFLSDEDINYEEHGDDVVVNFYIYQFGKDGQYIGRVNLF